MPAATGHAQRADTVIGLIDCANFYVSCERAFDPSLWQKPVAVLSNNDGCVIARSEEVKALGVRMGAPYFQVRRLLEGAGARVFSSNYSLYADMSGRVMDVVGTVTQGVAPYSIDEAFVRLPRLQEGEQLALGLEIHRKVKRWTGIPVRVGTGLTKVLAKVAQQLAKARFKRAGFPAAHVEPDRDDLLRQVAVEDVWGIGPAYAKKLRAVGVTDALGLRDVPDTWARQELTVVGLRLVYELRGVSCLPLEEVEEPRKSLVRSRSFGEKMTEVEGLKEAVATHASRAAEKLRAEGLTAAVLQVFITTGTHAARAYSNSCTIRLEQATNYTPALVRAAVRGVERLYRAGYAYRKAGVMLLELRPEEAIQQHLFAEQDPGQAALMAAMDAVNQRYGAGTVQLAACGLGKRSWWRKSDMQSRRYTTQADELPVARS